MTVRREALLDLAGDHYGVVIIEYGRCAFASDTLTEVEATALAAKLGPSARVVTVDELRMHKRSMMGGRS